MSTRSRLAWMLLALTGCSDPPDEPEECSVGQVECGGGCVAECAASELLDVDACACEARCGEGQVWDGAQCVEEADAGLTCEGDEVDCEGACVDLDVDPGHCGDCQRACDPFFACEDGECVCAGTSEECGETHCGDDSCEEGETPEGCAADCCEDEGYDCRLVGPQCGCVEEQACIVDPFTRGRVCVGAGETDDFLDCRVLDCRAGSACSEVVIDGDLAQTVCRPYCASNEDCGGGGSVCYHVAVDAEGVEVLDAKNCTMDCNPRTGDGCAPGYDCDMYVVDGRAMTECLLEGAGRDGDSCKGQSDCGRGFVCLEIDGGTCHEYCGVGAGCTNGTECQSFAEHLTLHGVEYGYCG